MAILEAYEDDRDLGKINLNLNIDYKTQSIFKTIGICCWRWRVALITTVVKVGYMDLEKGVN